MFAWLSDQLLPFQGRAAALELGAPSGRYDKALQQPKVTQDARVILKEPGPKDSRFRAASFATLEVPEGDARRQEFAEALRQLAKVRGLPLFFQKYTSGEGWISQQGLAPVISWEVEWKATGWTHEGRTFEQQGVFVVQAVSGERACASAKFQVLQVLRGPHAVTAEVHTGIGNFRYSHGQESWSETLPDSPSLEWFRGRAREGEKPDGIIAAINGISPGMAMLFFKQAFALRMPDVEAVAEYLRHDIDAMRLNAAVQPLIERAEAHWNAAWILRTSHERGELIRPTLLQLKARGLGAIEAILALREAFDLKSILPKGKVLVDQTCSPHFSDAEVQKTFLEMLDGNR